jgi:large subunit ribosomal protein L2
MALKTYNPTTSSQRGLILVDKSALWKGKPVKALTEGKRKTGGRNNKGHVTSRGIAGGHKQRYRYVDFKRRKWDMPATVERLEYDPNRTAFIALVRYEDGELAYILAPQRLAAGDTSSPAARTDVKPGNAMELGQMPVGTIVHNVEMKPGKGGQIARSAGTYVQVVGRDRGMVIVRLNSGEQRYIRSTAWERSARFQPDNQNQNFARPAAPAGWAASADPRRREEPGRPPARRRRRPHLGRPSPGHPVGQADQGCPHPHNKATDKMIIRSRHAKKKR